MSDGSASYIDAKGRTRWRGNDAVADRLKDLHDMLVIGGYDASHAARYPRLGYLISRHPEPITDLYRDDRLRAIPGVGGIVETILREIITTGTCAKMTEPSPESNYEPPPVTVLEMTAVPGMGAKTARRLYVERGINSLAALRDALASGALDDFTGLGPKLRQAILSARTLPAGV